jgi:hypothetical protein
MSQSRRLCSLLATFLLLGLLPAANSFVLLPSTPCSRPPRLAAVTEDQVLAAVEEAESLWAKALEARQKADEAAGKAEAVRAASNDSDTSHLSSQVLSLAHLADGMEADEFLQQAEEYSQQAEEIETRANAALAKTEALWEQHLKDFPDSPLA